LGTAEYGVAVHDVRAVLDLGLLEPRTAESVGGNEIAGSGLAIERFAAGSFTYFVDPLQGTRGIRRRRGWRPECRGGSRRQVSFGYFSQDVTIATTVAVIVAVASQPITCSGSGKMNHAMTDGRMVRRIIITITGTDTSPFSTALA
jgi:hypothetical protein